MSSGADYIKVQRQIQRKKWLGMKIQMTRQPKWLLNLRLCQEDPLLLNLQLPFIQQLKPQMSYLSLKNQGSPTMKSRKQTVMVAMTLLELLLALQAAHLGVPRSHERAMIARMRIGSEHLSSTIFQALIGVLCGTDKFYGVRFGSLLLFFKLSS